MVSNTTHIEHEDEEIERPITLCSGEVATLDDIMDLDYVGKNNQVTLTIFFNPEEYSSWNRYTFQYETYVDALDFIFLTPSIDEDYEDFPDEQKVLVDEIVLKIDISNFHVELPVLTGLFPSFKVGNYYGRPFTQEFIRVEPTVEYGSLEEIEGIIFATVKKLEWDIVVKAKFESQKLRHLTTLC